jgi:hypothetical protein
MSDSILTTIDVPPGSRFWTADKDPHRHVWSMLKRLEHDIQLRERNWRRWLSVLTNKTMSGLHPGESSPPEAAKNALGERQLALNPIEHCLSTLGARIASQRPTVEILVDTEGPEGYIRRVHAEMMSHLILGAWERGRFYRKSVKVFKHGGAVGFGAMHIYPGERHVKFETAAPWEFVVDEQAALSGETNTLLRIKYGPMERVIARFANSTLPSKFRAANQRAIEKAAISTGKVHRGYKFTTDMVKLVQAWHLPSGYGAEDGRSFVSVEGRTLTPREDWLYERDHFPFAFFPWDEPLIGWYPQGLVEMQEPVQHQVNKLLGRIQDILHLYAVQNTFYEEGTINKKHLKNTSGNLIPFKKGARPPVQPNMAPVAAELYRFVDALAAWVPRGTGVSEMAAHGTVPSRLESGRAIMEVRDNDTGRHALVNNAWDDFHVDAAELTVEAAEEIDDFEAHFRHDDRLETIRLSEVDLPRESYEVSAFPSSLLPHEPAGRRREVEIMQEAGWVDKAQALNLLRMPDLRQYRSLELAARDDIERQIYQILVHGEYRAPEPYQDIQLGLRMFTSALLRAEAQGAPKERLQMLKDWIGAADELEGQAQAAAAAMQGPPQGGPMPQMPPGGMPSGGMPSGEM